MKVTDDLDFVFVYLDDILITSHSRHEYRSHLRQMFQKISEHCLAINQGMCQFGISSINFLGQSIDHHGAVPLPAKVDAIHNFRKPTTVKGMQELVCMVPVYHHFMPAASSVMQPPPSQHVRGAFMH